MMFRYKMISVLLLFIIVGLCGCGDAEVETIRDGQYYLYFTNKSSTELSTTIYTPKSKEPVTIANEMLKLLSENTEEVQKVKSIPDNVKVQKVDIVDKIAYITFNKEYLKLDAVQDIVCRGSVVLTLTQLDQIDYVRFYIDGENLTDKSGVVVEEMQASDFVDTEADIINMYTKVNVTLYFANSDGKILRPYVYEGAVSNNSSVEKYVVEQIIAGPKVEGFGKTISDKVELIGVTTKDDICYVNFGSNFLDESMDINGNITIYSIVNSLCELSHINKVQILVNGEVDKKYHNEISLSGAFFRNLDYIEEFPEVKKIKK